jgi:hypothetical protein
MTSFGGDFKAQPIGSGLRCARKGIVKLVARFSRGEANYNDVLRGTQFHHHQGEIDIFKHPF